MNKKVIIIKVSHRINDSNKVKQAFNEITEHVEESYSSHSMEYYVPTNDASIANLYFLTENENYQITSQNDSNKIDNKIKELKEDHIVYRISNNKSNLFFVLCYQDNVKTLYVGEGPIQIQKGSSKLKFYYQILLKYTSCENELIINNFEKLQFLEEGDFGGFMICCENMDLVKQFRYLIEQKKKTLNINYFDMIEKDEDAFDDTSEDEQTDTKSNMENSDKTSEVGQLDTMPFQCDLKQKDEFCERPFFISKLTSTGNRTNFQRDYERIIHAKAFRRLVDKAQIFTSSKGDHYRTRMTHTMEVAQIARGIAKELDLNIELTEAIALAHDIGHTPFGHQGERTLNDILNGKIEGICNREDEKKDFGGFKHNLHGIRVVTVLEEKYYEHEGINLSYQVLEGILKHTSFLSCKRCKTEEGKNCKGMQGQCTKTKNDLKDFLPENFDDTQLYLQYKFSTTLEGQVVAIADEIAQRSHDIDDALRSNLITFQDLKNYLCFEKFEELKKIITEIENKFINNEEEILFNNGKDVLHGRVISEIITFFMNKVCEQSKIKIVEYSKNKDKKEFFENNKRVNEELICFDKNTQKLCQYLEEIISKKVITCNEVACFDNKAKMIVLALFKAYFEKPLLLPQTVLLRVFKKTINNNYNCDKDNKDNDIINMTVSDSSVVAAEIQYIIQPDRYKLNISDKIIQDAAELEKLEQAARLNYFEKQKILVRAIVDYIAGMTDSYAVNEYNRIYKA